MTSPYLLSALVIAASSGTNLFSQVQEMEQAVELDLTGSKLSGSGIRILNYPCKVKLEHGRALIGRFLVGADASEHENVLVGGHSCLSFNPALQSTWAPAVLPSSRPGPRTRPSL